VRRLRAVLAHFFISWLHRLAARISAALSFG
jgi:hypothetical protein